MDLVSEGTSDILEIESDSVISTDSSLSRFQATLRATYRRIKQRTRGSTLSHTRKPEECDSLCQPIFQKKNGKEL